mmetsp:Transcript_44072/g.82410  ORF Transcript_44072/g.82410 Transcript_44072/m.82410 type:complete len:223 (-) Transcript_44072:954-1622(-)
MIEALTFHERFAPRSSTVLLIRATRSLRRNCSNTLLIDSAKSWKSNGNGYSTNQRGDVEWYVTPERTQSVALPQKDREAWWKDGTAESTCGVGPTVDGSAVLAFRRTVQESEGGGEHHPSGGSIDELTRAQDQISPGAILVWISEETVNRKEAVGDAGENKADTEGVEEAQLPRQNRIEHQLTHKQAKSTYVLDDANVSRTKLKSIGRAVVGHEQDHQLVLR